MPRRTSWTGEALALLGRCWPRSRASGRETVRQRYGERPRAKDPAASGVRRRRKRRRPGALEQNLQRSVDRTTLPKETGREMEVDVRSLGEAPRHPALVAGALELFQAPEPHTLRLFLTIDNNFRRRNALDLFHTP